ncbi:selenocysteine-specific translation elongation factor [Actinoplanes sp. TBRC 11911]|uniref:selenocysteine-specific translation elongation factor n=1 Tax=Actinoplanes sp. TBRC 11911 TaxID=2729386 RepID=UPI00145EB6A1|nr:selenocysteine-specific translation elongation factor [Actinoplanes sp. TBRC 11911]NMO52832.1 selenocysteine-specific translation elongation factor [Actinoplanes sp. TBRC 11911]
MHVLATAGHVDHGKSTLVRALTGMEPDRWAEERRRGMTIDLGFAWTTLASGQTVAFVDVPGHERFVPNMLAGVGPVPAAMIVVAADEGWMPQSAEHLAALDALGVRHGLLVVTRSDLADPETATDLALTEIAATSLGAVETVAVSGATGQGLDLLRAALDRLVTQLPDPNRTSPVRLWIDRVFTIKGAGTVVTGTLGAGRLRTGDELDLGGDLVRVRGLQSMGRPADEITAVARVAVNLRGAAKDRIARGDALLTPGRFRRTDLIDVRVHGDAVADLPATLTLHAGSAAIPVRLRPLGTDTCRLRLARPLPLRIGDRALLRDPGRHHVAGGVTVLDVLPPGLSRRGAAAARAKTLSNMSGTPDLADELRRRHLIRAADLAAMGVPELGSQPVTADWYAHPPYWADKAGELVEHVAGYRREHPLEPGIPLDALRHLLGLPDRALVEALVHPPLTIRQGRVSTGDDALPDALRHLINDAFAGLSPFAAPEAYALADRGLGPRQLAAAVRTGQLIQLTPGVVLRAGAVEQAAELLKALPQPFTLSEARRALDTTRRVAVPLLELLDHRGVTERLPDDRRAVRPGPAVSPETRRSDDVAPRRRIGLEKS